MSFLCDRVEYDAYRTDLESLNLGPRDGSTAPRIDDAQKKFSAHKEKFDRLRADVAIKLKFLEENKVRKFYMDKSIFDMIVKYDKLTFKTHT